MNIIDAISLQEINSVLYISLLIQFTIEKLTHCNLTCQIRPLLLKRCFKAMSGLVALVEACKPDKSALSCSLFKIKRFTLKMVSYHIVIITIIMMTIMAYLDYNYYYCVSNQILRACPSPCCRVTLYE